MSSYSLTSWAATEISPQRELDLIPAPARDAGPVEWEQYAVPAGYEDGRCNPHPPIRESHSS